MKKIKYGVAAIVLAGAAAALSACADGYTSTGSSVSFGVSSYEGYPYRGYSRGYRDWDRDGVPNRYDRDRDGDSVPNRFDTSPNNPRWP